MDSFEDIRVKRVAVAHHTTEKLSILNYVRGSDNDIHTHISPIDVEGIR